jgi:hypothetical protein
MIVTGEKKSGNKAFGRDDNRHAEGLELLDRRSDSAGEKKHILFSR